MDWDQLTEMPPGALGINERFAEFFGRQRAEVSAGDRDRPITSIADLAGALEALGWPEPTDWTADSFRWVVITDGRTLQISARFGPELARISTVLPEQEFRQTGLALEMKRIVPPPEELEFRLTGRSGILITGDPIVRTTLGEVLDSFNRSFERAPDELLRLFGLKHDHLFPGSPVVPLDFAPTVNERGEMLRSIGQL